MKKIYFGGHFKKTKDSLDVAQMLRNDYRAILLQDAEHMAYYRDNLKINDNYIYAGPFYVEKTEDGQISATDSVVVLTTEYNQVKNCDIFVAVFDECFSAGTVTELAWALNMNKQIYILYKYQESVHDIKSDYWFPIADAMRRNKNTQIFAYSDDTEIINLINQNILRN